MIARMLSLLAVRRRVSLDTVLESADAHGPGVDDPVRPAPSAAPRTPFDSETPGLRPSLATLGPRDRLRAARRMLPLLADMVRGTRMYTRPRPGSRARLDPSELEQIEALARRHGAKDIGYVEVPSTSIFRDTPIPYRSAAVFTVEMDEGPIATMPSFDAQLEVVEGYGRLARIANAVARDLRDRGIAALPGTALGGTTDYVQLGELAGLGAIGYHGLLITPGEGARVRIGVVYLQAENLPRRTPGGHMWIREFCSMCRKCIRACPVQAIYDAPQQREGARFQTIDHGTCRDYFLENFGCGVCLSVCPFSRAGYEAIHGRFRGAPSAPRYELPMA